MSNDFVIKYHVFIINTYKHEIYKYYFVESLLISKNYDFTAE